MVNDNQFLNRFSFRHRYLSTRPAKAEKILLVLQREGLNCETSSLLDIGCSRGHISHELSRVFKRVIGIDLNNENWEPASSVKFIQANACHLPVASGSFNVVVMNHLIEHVASPELLMREVGRVLCEGGICYLACPNRFSLIEPHYRLPLLSWLPRSIADRYVRMVGRGESYLDRMPSYWGLRAMIRQFEVKDLTTDIIKNPDIYLRSDPELRRKAHFITWLPSWFFRFMAPLLPVWVLILRKD
jgi:SAM-dependent methyltransferase